MFCSETTCRLSPGNPKLVIALWIAIASTATTETTVPVRCRWTRTSADSGRCLTSFSTTSATSKKTAPRRSTPKAVDPTSLAHLLFGQRSMTSCVTLYNDIARIRRSRYLTLRASFIYSILLHRSLVIRPILRIRYRADYNNCMHVRHVVVIRSLKGTRCNLSGNLGSWKYSSPDLLFIVN